YPALIIATLVLLAGCSSPPRTGVRIGDETLEQLEAGVTTREWLVALIGEPSSRSVVQGVENTEVYRYTLVEHKGGMLAGLIGGGSQSSSVIYFILTDGVVTRYWADRETN